jgi:hypothetical protein
MTLGIGAYRIGDGPIRLKPTPALKKVTDGLANSGLFEIDTHISTQKAGEVLEKFGLKPKQVSKILPQSGDVRHVAAHGAVQMSSNGKPVYQMVESLKRPFTTFLADNIKKGIRRLF